MALSPFSLRCCINLPQNKLIGGLRRPTTQLSAATFAVGTIYNPIIISPILRLTHASKLQRRKDFLAVYASKDNPTEENSLVDTSDEIKAGQGPPFLTILAGFIVIFLVGWIVWSILISLIGFIVRLFPSK